MIPGVKTTEFWHSTGSSAALAAFAFDHSNPTGLRIAAAGGIAFLAAVHFAARTWFKASAISPVTPQTAGQFLQSAFAGKVVGSRPAKQAAGSTQPAKTS